jgi:GNAT superfamily N-acetyltransferase
MPTYNLKLATPEDLPVIVGLVSMAQKDLAYKLPFSPERVLQVLTEVLKQGVIICLTVETNIVGVFIALKTVTVTSMEPVAAELLWYVLPDYRKSRGALELLAAFEYWAREVAKVGVITMSNMTNTSAEMTNKLYLRRGYKLSEQTYFKRVN